MSEHTIRARAAAGMTAAIVLAALPATGAAAATPESVTMVNATGERWTMEIDGTPADVVPEELVAAPGAFSIGTSGRPFGSHTFTIYPKGSSTVAAELVVDVTERSVFDYALVIHYDADGEPQLSMWLDDRRRVPSGQTRVEIRNVAYGGAVNARMRSNGENPSIPDDQRAATINHNDGIELNGVTVNDYELLGVRRGKSVPPSSSTSSSELGNLLFAFNDLELEGKSASVVYVTGRMIEARDLANADVDHTRGYTRVTLDLDSQESAFQRSGFNDPYALRGYAGAATTTANPVPTGSSSQPAAQQTEPIASTDTTSGSTSGGGSPLAERGASFADVSPDNIFVEEIGWLDREGVTRGCNPPTNDRFCPDSVVTRGQMAAFANRYLGLSAASRDYFVDDESSVFESDINAIAGARITRGCNPPTNDRFCPDRVITRAEMAVFLDRIFDLAGSSKDVFVDDTGSFAEESINAIAAVGITKGCNPPTNDRFCPDDPVTREQMAAFLERGDATTG